MLKKPTSKRTSKNPYATTRTTTWQRLVPKTHTTPYIIYDCSQPNYTEL